MINQENKPDSAASGEKKTDSTARYILSLTLKLLLISTVTAMLLAGVNALTAERIADNIAEEKANAIRAIFPDADESLLLEETYDGVSAVYLVNAGGEPLGYTASVTPLGFGGKFDIMVGVGVRGGVVGIQIVSHSETPGLGSRVNDEEYLGQYTDKSGNLALGSDIDAITGSTVSSKAVLAGVNDALGVYDALAAEYGFAPDGGKD